MARTKRYERGDLQSAAAMAAAIADLMKAMREPNYPHEIPKARAELATLLTAIRDRKGVVLYHDYEECAWGWPDAVWRLSAGEAYSGSRAKVGVRFTTENGEYVTDGQLHTFAVAIITAPHDGVVPRFGGDGAAGLSPRGGAGGEGE